MQQWRSNWEAREGGGNQWRGVIITRESKRKYKYKLQFKKDSNTNEGKFLYCNITISLSDRWNEAFKQEEEEYFNG